MLDRFKLGYTITTKDCECGNKFKTKSPRIYGRGDNGVPVVVNYDVICAKCKTIRNIDIP